MRKRQGLLDALRFVAALYLVMFHFATYAPVRLYEWLPVLNNGFMATNLFLILSGFILTRLHAQELQQGKLSSLRFLARRLVRIWPGHLVVLSAFVAMVLVMRLLKMPVNDPLRYDFGALLPQALLIHAWGIPSELSWNYPTWTLSALVFCYLAFPLLIHLTCNPRYPIWWLFGSLALLQPLDFLGTLITGESLPAVPIWLGILRALPLFLVGVSMARVDSLKRSRRQHSGFNVALSLCSGFTLLQLWLDSPLWIVGVNALVVLLAAHASTTPHLKVIGQKLGDLSFSLYLIHFLVATVWFTGGWRVLQLSARADAWQAWLLWLMAFPVTFVFAGLFMKFVDQPLQRRLRPRFEAWADSGWVSEIRIKDREHRRSWALHTQEMPVWDGKRTEASTTSISAAEPDAAAQSRAEGVAKSLLPNP